MLKTNLRILESGDSMKVVKEGTTHLTDITCDRCESELQYEPNDVRHSLRIEEVITYVWCPVCRHQIIIERKHIDDPVPKKRKWWHRFVDDSDWPPV